VEVTVGVEVAVAVDVTVAVEVTVHVGVWVATNAVQLQGEPVAPVHIWPGEAASVALRPRATAGGGAAPFL